MKRNGAEQSQGQIAAYHRVGAFFAAFSESRKSIHPSISKHGSSGTSQHHSMSPSKREKEFNVYSLVWLGGFHASRRMDGMFPFISFFFFCRHRGIGSSLVFLMTDWNMYGIVTFEKALSHPLLFHLCVAWREIGSSSVVFDNWIRLCGSAVLRVLVGLIVPLLFLRTCMREGVTVYVPEFGSEFTGAIHHIMPL